MSNYNYTLLQSPRFPRPCRKKSIGLFAKILHYLLTWPIYTYDHKTYRLLCTVASYYF